MNSFLLTLALTSLPLQVGIARARQFDHIGSEQILSAFSPAEADLPKLSYWRLVNAFRLNNKKEALRQIELLEFLPELPDRYKVTVALMKNELSLWKDKRDDLGDISREMKKVQDRLKHARGGPQTQALQKDIADRLKKMVENEQGKAQAQAKAQQGKEQRQASQSPARDSQIMPDAGRGTVKNMGIRRLSEAWGNMNRKQRDDVLQNLTRDLPRRHREAIENYFRNLSRAK